jgi:hypothetical protein
MPRLLMHVLGFLVPLGGPARPGVRGVFGVRANEDCIAGQTWDKFSPSFTISIVDEVQAYRKSHRRRQAGNGTHIHLARDTDLKTPRILVLLEPDGLLAHPVSLTIRRWAS